MHAIVAYDSQRGIGRAGGLPWHAPEDLRRFKAITHRGIVIYGRRTWDSLPPAHRPLPGRANIIISRAATATGTATTATAAGTHRPGDDGDGETSVAWVASVDAATERATRLAATRSSPNPNIYVIGGESIYREFLRRGLVAVVEATEVSGSAYDCDRHFPELGPWFRCVRTVPGGAASVPALCYKRFVAAGNPAEQQYLDLVGRAIRTGVARADRTGVGTRSLFGAQLRFDLSGGKVPLLTTKPVFWRGIVEELLWFLRGDTDAKVLAARGVHFWDANGSREFQATRGLHHYPAGILGPVYGWQWRRFDAPYTSVERRSNATAPQYTSSAIRAAGHDGSGPTDQVKRVVELLRCDPTTRRAIISAWNPNQLSEMVLPPCHVLYQFWISADKRLHCAVYQRSGDLGLGVPFNIASAALLTHLIASAVGGGVVGHELVHFIADAHVYESHVAPLRRQLARTPRPFPTVSIAPDRTGQDVWGTRAEDIRLHNYTPCRPGVPLKMAL